RPIPFLAGGHLWSRGVIETVFDERGERFPGILWVADPSEVVFGPPKEIMSVPATARPTAPLISTGELTSIHQINEALKSQPDKVFNVKVRGVITYIDLGLAAWYLQDGQDSISVAQAEAGLSPYLQQEGMYVELQGTAGGNSSVGISPTTSVRVLGKGRMPEPLRHSIDYLASGNDDGKWVQLQGVVTAFEKQRLTLNVNGTRIIVWVNEIDPSAEDRL